MWSFAIVSVLLVGAMAQKPPQHHEPCCAPRYFTYKQVDVITTAPGGELQVEYERVEGAYDAISEQISLFFDAEYFNGTEVLGRYIADFKERVLYAILKVGDEEHCFPSHFDYRFPEDCIPDDAKFIQDQWLGESDFLTDTWYVTRKDPTGSEVHAAVTVGSKDCVPVNQVATQVDSTTGELLGVIDRRTFDFELGISDREHFFKVPEVCQPGNALKEPTMAVQKILDKISRQRKFLGQ